MSQFLSALKRPGQSGSGVKLPADNTSTPSPAGGAGTSNDLEDDQDMPIPITKARSEMGRSRGTGASFNSAYPNAIEVSETIKTKFFAMKWVWISLVYNLLLLWLLIALWKGLWVPLESESATVLGCVIIELILIFANSVTIAAVNEGVAAYFGYRMSSRSGYSLAVCGYLQAPTILDKIYFPNTLSLNSTCRQLLSRISLIWMILGGFLILSPFAATSTIAFSIRQQSGTIPCVVMHERRELTDRKFPTMEVEIGISEMVFGTALGTPRSEFPVDESIALLVPQMVGAAADGDTLAGPGYAVNVITNCSCSPSTDMAGFVEAGVSTGKIPFLLGGIDQIGSAIGMSNILELKNTGNVSSQYIEITSAIPGTFICGGANYSSPDIPICTTKIHNFTHQNVLVTFMTDGTPASIAPKSAIELSEADMVGFESFFSKFPKSGETANLTRLAFAMNAIMSADNSSASSFALPPTVPAMINPILFWLTPNLMQIDPTLLEAGIETTFMILLRAAAQRTFHTTGTFCIRNVQVPGASILYLKDYGGIIAIVFVTFQIFSSLLAIMFFIPWILSSAPIGPAVRLMKDTVFFTTLVHASTLYSSDTLCNAQPYVIWQALDIVVRVGETFKSRDEEIVGHITVDRPKYISALTNGRRYN